MHRDVPGAVYAATLAASISTHHSGVMLNEVKHLEPRTDTFKATENLRL
jgi:hypothetical protein